MTQTITARQRQVLDAIRAYWRENGIPPSLADLSESLGVTQPTVHKHLHALKRKGYLEHIERSGRTWKPKTPSAEQEHTVTVGETVVALDRVEAEVFRVPLLGRVAAGSPILAVVEGEEFILWERARPGEVYFGLIVEGNSMIGAQIHDGDIVVVRQQQVANNGDVVVALIDDNEVVVKQFQQRPDEVVLLSRNRCYAPIVFSGDRKLQILGKVVEARHRFDT